MNPKAFRRFLAFHYLPGDETPFRSVYKLLPGHSLIVENGSTRKICYWDLDFTRERHQLTFEAAKAELHTLLDEAVRQHMIADVPVGVLLSGGMDSSALLSFAVNATNQKVSTFTVGFSGMGVVDERPFAATVAKRFGSSHHDISISAKDFWEFLPSYIWHMEEPVHEPPAVALFYISKFAKQFVKVLISGEGGDEAFGGYPNYPGNLRLRRFENSLGVLTRSVGTAMNCLGSITGDHRFKRYGYACGRPLGSHYFSRTSSPASYFNRNAEKLFTPDFRQCCPSLHGESFVCNLLRRTNAENLLDQMLYVDTKTWLPDDLLVKADKITMANSIELRVPMLDHHVLEFASSLPLDFKVRGKETKRILKSAFKDILPAKILARKKAGFPVPYNTWLRGELRPQVEEILLSKQALSRGYLKPEAVRNILSSNAAHGHLGPEVFCLLVIELWHRIFIERTSAQISADFSSSLTISS